MQFLPVEQIGASVLFVPPFAEEMNRSRLMVSRQARQLALAGHRAVIVDLFGTGDSDGEFGDATWDGWCRDLEYVNESLFRSSDGPVVIWSLRLGALLALSALRRGQLEAQHLMLWSPCLNGATFMNQLLRLRLMSSMIAATGKKESVADIRSRLQDGTAVEIAGYEISPAMFAAVSNLDARSLLLESSLPLTWYEIIADEQTAFPPASQSVVNALRETGRNVNAASFVGPKFWSTVETTVAEQLIERTLQHAHDWR